MALLAVGEQPVVPRGRDQRQVVTPKLPRDEIRRVLDRAARQHTAPRRRRARVGERARRKQKEEERPHDPYYAVSSSICLHTPRTIAPVIKARTGRAPSQSESPAPAKKPPEARTAPTCGR